MLPSLRTVASLVIAALAMSACRSKPAAVPPPAAAPAAAPQAPRENRDSIAAAARAAEQARLAAAAAAEAARNTAMLTEVRNTLTRVIYFDYDRDEIRDDQRVALDAKVPILNANPNVRIRIAGHTDNRGSDEYNLALSQRRSAAAKRYLVSRGITDGRIDVVGFGEERPAAQGDGEDAWGRNRRDEFEIIAGGDALRIPR